MTEGRCARARKFTPQKLFFSVLHLAAATNSEGYQSALHQTWYKCGLKLTDTPTKSSLSEFRSHVSYKFFEDIFKETLKQKSSPRPTHRGFHIYAIDGDSLDLPASQDVFKQGYRGYPFKGDRETHYPKMYTAHCFDIISGRFHRFGHSPTQDEVHLARSMAATLEKNSITIYDRLHCGYRTFSAHEKAGNYFIARARTRGRSTKREVLAFCKSSKRNDRVVWRPITKKRILPDFTLRLVKVKNPRTGEDLAFVTNLTPAQFSNREIAQLYQRRWDIEGAFRDITVTLKLQQWHAKSLNGVLQEIFSLLWLANTVKRACGKIAGTTKKWLAKEYEKTNFKLGCSLLMNHLDLLIKYRKREFWRIFQFCLRRSAERRKRLSRSYPRVIKHRGREYPPANAVPRR